MTFGTPTGRACIAGVTRAVPPEPPAEITPATPGWRDIQRSSPTAISRTDAPRSLVNTALGPFGW